MDYADTFEYGFQDAQGRFHPAETHIRADAGGWWRCDVYGIDGEIFEAYGKGPDFFASCCDALDQLPFELDDTGRSDYTDHVTYTVHSRTADGMLGI